MIPMFQSLWAHLTWADDTILKTVSAQEGAPADQDLLKLLHHIVTVERFFLTLFQGTQFDMERFRTVPGTLAEIEQSFAEAHADGAAYVARLDNAELARTVEFPVPAFKDFHPPIRHALMQVIMHGEHHRAQAASRLRALGAKPPTIDYILWVRENPLS